MNTLPVPTATVAPETWRGFAASIPGSGHIRCGIPCQDASLVLTSPRPALIVCDGRGSAAMSHFGSQGATAAFKRQLSIMEPFLARILDREEGDAEQWEKFCRILYRTLWQVQLDLAEERELEPKEFDFTVALAVVGKCHIGCFQVGDGSIVLRQNGVCRTVFPPEKGEFANQTHFLRQGGEGRLTFRRDLFPAKENSGIAITSDGPEHLMFRLSDMTPGKVFDCFFDDLAAGEFCRQDLMDYLTDRGWNDDPRGADDRSIALLIPPIAKGVPPEAEQNPTDETAKPAPPATEPEPADETAAVAPPATEPEPADETAAVAPPEPEPEPKSGDESPVSAQTAEPPAAPPGAGEAVPGRSPQSATAPDVPELSQQPPDAVSSPCRSDGFATRILAVLLALMTVAGFGYGWHQHSRLVAAERSHAASVGDLQAKLASSENEVRRLHSELRQVETASRPDSTAAPAAHDPVPPKK